jgi:hypothetical protein
MNKDEKVRIHRPEEIDKISDIVHDCLFDLDDVKFNADQSCVRIKFRLPDPGKTRVRKLFWILKEVEMPTVECFLNIHHVVEYLIDDPVKIGTYCLIDLEYNDSHKRVSVICAQPLKIDVTVTAFEISVEVTDQVVEVRKFKSVFTDYSFRGLGSFWLGSYDNAWKRGLQNCYW